MKVEIIKDSICNGKRITTFHLQYWRPLLAEMNTHRVFSRNASSSRAMSFEKMKEQVLHPYLPTHWNAEQKGMVGGEEFSEAAKNFINDEFRVLARTVWNRLEQIQREVDYFYGQKIHKQYINRYLEPFRPVDQLVTATDWDNFFQLRCAEDAQPEIRDVAKEMQRQMNENTPTVLEPGQWHLPYITDEEMSTMLLGTDVDEPSLLQNIKLSAARCARISYSNYDAIHTVEGDIKLANRLLKNGHMSPFEHQATPGIGKYFNLDGWESARHYLF